MSRNRGRDTAPEVRLRRALWKLGLRYRLGSDLPGRPDLVFPRARLAVFVDGCFWHSCPEHGVLPKNNASFWIRKLARTRERDAATGRQLSQEGWRVVRLWEHDISLNAASAAERVALAVRSSS
jgi:DNA mismatch endonuclease (patch repair protein)